MLFQRICLSSLSAQYSNFFLIPYSLHLLLVLDFMQTSLNASTYQKLEPNRYGLFSLFISVPFLIKCVGIMKELFQRPYVSRKVKLYLLAGGLYMNDAP